MFSYWNRALLMGAVLCKAVMCMAQPKEFHWPSATTHDNVPDSLLQNHDALIISDAHNYNYFSEPEYPVVHSAYLRIKILTDLGLLQSSYIFIPRMPDQEILVMDARTIKPDGRIIDLNSSDIFSTNLIEGEQKNDQGANPGFSRFAIPGVEVGDEIEIAYSIGMRQSALTGEIIPNTYAYSLSTIYRFNFPSNMELICEVFNGFPEPELNEKDNRIRATFYLNDLESVINENNSILYLEEPWVSYRLYPATWNLQDAETLWKMLEVGTKRSLKYTKSNRHRYVKFYQSFLSDKTCSTGSLSSFERFRILYNYLVDSMEIRPVLTDKESGKSNEYYLYRGFMDRMVMNKLILQFLDELNLKYHFCYGRNRYRGPIHVDRPSALEIDEYLLLIYDSGHAPHFLMLNHPDSRFDIDEIPAHLAGTSVSYVSTEGFQPVIDTIRLPEWDTRASLLSVNLELSIDPERPDTGQMEILGTHSGFFTCYFKEFHQMIGEDTLFAKAFLRSLRESDPDIHPDTSETISTERVYPFKRVYSNHAWIENAFNLINDTLLSIPLHHFVQHNDLQSESKHRILDFYPEFKYVDSVNLSIILPVGYQYEVINPDDAETGENNTAGRYEMHLSVTNRGISVFSVYSIDADRIPSEKIGELDQINAAYDRGKNTALLISFKSLK